MAKLIGEREEKKIKELYKNGLNWNQIAKELGFNKTSIYGARDRMRLGKKRRFNFDEKYALTLIKKGLTDSEVACELKISIMSVQRCRWKNGIDRSQLGRKTNKDIVHFFKSITPESCYWAGVLMADGGITNPNGNYTRVCLNQCEMNAELIEQFSKVVNRPMKFKATRDHRTKKIYHSRSVQIDSVHLVKILEDIWGIMPRKSFTATIPTWLIQRNDKLVFHWIRGYFDGDGGIHINKLNHPRLAFSGTTSVLEFIRKKLHPDSKAKIDISRSIPTFTISGRKSVFKSGEKMWKDSRGLRMERKYKSYAKWKKEACFNQKS